MTKTTIQLNRMILVALSFMLLLLAGCGDGQTAFTDAQMAGKTFAYAKSSGTTGATGALAFNADGTWRSALGADVIGARSVIFVEYDVR